MAAANRALLAALMLLGLSGCAAAGAGAPLRIALLAPFEGRYREIGYDALYAARLALQDSAQNGVELLPIDDGGSAASAADRARALALDSATQAIIALGYDAAQAVTQGAAGDLPVIVVGDWNVTASPATVFLLTAPQLDAQRTTPPRISVTDAARLPVPLTGGEILALSQFPRLRPALDRVTVVSSAALPNSDFAARYRASDPFAPEPGLLASLVYDAVQMSALAAASDADRTAVTAALTSMRYDGLNGLIHFEGQYWADAPVHRYTYSSDRTLMPVDGVVE